MSKSMSVQARQELLESIREKYQSSDAADKKLLLNGFILASGYERKYALKIVNSKTTQLDKKTKKRGKPAYYDETVVQVLEFLWHASNQICSTPRVEEPPFL